MKIKFLDTYPEDYGPNAGKSTHGKATVNGVTTLQILAECGGVRRMVQGFTTDAERDAIAHDVFADVIKAGVAPAAKVEPEYDGGWAAEIDAVKAESV
jgi:hypothetical protein